MQTRPHPETRPDPARGQLIADLLKGAWRDLPEPPTLTEAELATIMPLLVKTGADALAWWKIRASPLRETPAGRRLHTVYREQALAANLADSEVARIVKHLHSREIEPLLFKGRAIARIYPQPGLRPASDIDLMVPPEQFACTQTALDELAPLALPVDVDRGFLKTRKYVYLADTDWQGLYQHASSLQIGDVEVRVLGPEDHLQLLCVHMLKHCGYRPLWLCDIAAALEASTSTFDWSRCMGTAPVKHWVECAFGLAHVLLGAKIEGTPAADVNLRMPSWLVQEILKRWSVLPPYFARTEHPPLKTIWRDPVQLVHQLHARWPDPFEATLNLKGSFHQPALLYQFGYVLDRTRRFVVRELFVRGGCS